MADVQATAPNGTELNWRYYVYATEKFQIVLTLCNQLFELSFKNKKKQKRGTTVNGNYKEQSAVLATPQPNPITIAMKIQRSMASAAAAAAASCDFGSSCFELNSFLAAPDRVLLTRWENEHWRWPTAIGQQQPKQQKALQRQQQQQQWQRQPRRRRRLQRLQFVLAFSSWLLGLIVKENCNIFRPISFGQNAKRSYATRREPTPTIVVVTL